MPHLPEELGSFPLILRDYDIINPRRGELLFNYDTNQLYFVRPSTGEVISVAQDIYNKIISSKIKNNKIIIYDADKDTSIGKDDIVPPLEDREYNSFYYIVTGRKRYSEAVNMNPLTTPTWAVKSGKTFYGKNSGYISPDAEE